ncbi:glycoside hydrolase 15 protein [Irineochytrium annulatum]|nr:glycoside hydrolase 15 protein [Irineochytrium annulatum]
MRVFASLVILDPSTNLSSKVEVLSYLYDGSALSGDVIVENVALDKVVKIKYSTLDGTWEGECDAAYASGPELDNFETWAFNCPIDARGISQFFVQYEVDGNIYYDNGCGYDCNYPVNAGKPPPTGPAPDITAWFNASYPVAIKKLKANLHPANTKPGVVVAAPESNVINNYFYHWIRDAGLVMSVVNSLYVDGDESVEALFADHQVFNHDLQNKPLLSGLGEVKVHVNGDDYTGDWCRPQNDGPALRASSFIRFAKAYYENTDDMARVLSMYNSSDLGVIVADLDYIAKPSTYEDAEGVLADIYLWTLGAQQRALHEGAELATFLGDTRRAVAWSKAAKALSELLPSFYDQGTRLLGRGLSDRTLDSAITLHAIHNAHDGPLGPSDDRLLRTVHAFASTFEAEYAVNRKVRVDVAGLPLAHAIGRYLGDVYDGSIDFSNGRVGNPWYLTTMAVAELYYKTATAYIREGSVSVTPLNRRFFLGPRPAGLGLSRLGDGEYDSDSETFDKVVGALQSLGDSYARRVKHHSGEGELSLSEQFGREDGHPTGVKDLTWSYASLISAARARREMLQLQNR